MRLSPYLGMSWEQNVIGGSYCGVHLLPVHHASLYDGSSAGASTCLRLLIARLRAFRARLRAVEVWGFFPRGSSFCMGVLSWKGFKRFFSISS